MNRYTITLSTFLLLIVNSTLFAKNSTAAIQCFDKELHLIIKDNQLNLTEEALMDNTGGYVDIPEERLYIKLDQTAYKVKGVIVKDNKNNTNILNATLDNQLAFLIYKLTDKQHVKFIQKIDLEENNTIKQLQNITTTNILNISFDKRDVEKEYQKCKEK